MAWTAPRTWVVGEIVTAALGNVHWRDNLLAINTLLDIAAGTYADGGILLGSGATAISIMARLTNGQIAVGGSAGDPVGRTVIFIEVDDGNSGAADTIDWTTGLKHKSTLTANCTYTFTAPVGPCNMILRVIQDVTGSRTVTWPTTVKWPGGTAPVLTTTANAIDLFAFYFDGTNYNGVSSLDHK